MTMEGWHMGRKDSAGNQAGTARMTVGDRFWARRIRPIFDDGDLTLEQKSVFCCIVTPYGEDRDGELCMVPIPAEVVREGVQCRE